MKKILLFLITLTVLSYSQIVDTVVAVGGIGTAEASDLNGGMCLSYVGWTQMQTNAGGPVDTALNATATNNGSSLVRVTQTGKFDGAMVGIYVYCDFATVYTDGRYLITAVDASDNYIDINLTYSADATVSDCHVGGAMATIAATTASTTCLNNNRIIKISNIQVWNTVDDGAIIKADKFTPTWNSNDHAEGFRATPRFEGVAAATGIVDRANKTELAFSSTNSAIISGRNFCYDNFFMHGTNASGGGVVGSSALSYNSIKNCVITGISGSVLYFDDANYVFNTEIYGCTGEYIVYGNNADGVTFYNCNVHNNAGYVFVNGSFMGVNCKFRNNVHADQQVRFNNGTLIGCELSQDSLDQGCLLKISDQYTGPFVLSQNTFFGGRNTGGVYVTGIRGSAAWDNAVGMCMPVSGNLFDGCDTGVVITNRIKSAFYDGNNFSNCGVNYSAKPAEDATNTTTYDPQFTDVDAGDYSVGNANVYNATTATRAQKWNE